MKKVFYIGEFYNKMIWWERNVFFFYVGMFMMYVVILGMRFKLVWNVLKI